MPTLATITIYLAIVAGYHESIIPNVKFATKQHCEAFAQLTEAYSKDKSNMQNHKVICVPATIIKDFREYN